MAYLNNIPQANNFLSDSQVDLLNNFIAIKQLVDVNHATFGDANEGKHKWVTCPVQAATPATAAGEMALYTKTSAITAVPEMFIRKQSNGTEYEFTSATFGAQGWTRLPSGILLKWGSTNTGAGSSIITFPGAPAPVFTSIFSIQVTTSSSNNSDTDTFVRLQDFNAPWTSFTVWSSNRASTPTAKAARCQYLAIGV